MNKRLRLAAGGAVMAVAAVAGLAGCGSGGSSSSSIAPPWAGTAVVPCSVINSQLAAIMPSYAGMYAEWASNLYSLETALATQFGNVSNMDQPLALSEAEVNVSGDAMYITPNEPATGADGAGGMETDMISLATACGWTQNPVSGTWVKP